MCLLNTNKIEASVSDMKNTVEFKPIALTRNDKFSVKNIKAVLLSLTNFCVTCFSTRKFEGKLHLQKFIMSCSSSNNNACKSFHPSIYSSLESLALQFPPQIFSKNYYSPKIPLILRCFNGNDNNGMHSQLKKMMTLEKNSRLCAKFWGS